MAIEEREVTPNPDTPKRDWHFIAEKPAQYIQKDVLPYALR